jgi:Tol biopolymer transport system component
LGSSGTPRWSPDGSEIVLDSEHGGNREIYVMNSQGGTPRRITADPAEDCLPSFSRDGRTIYFTSDRTGRCEVWRVARTGGAAVQLTRNGGVAPIETTDGKRVLYCRRIWDASELWSLPVEGGPETRVLGNIIVRDGTAWTVTPRGVITLEAAQDPTTRQLNDIVPGRGTPLAIQPGPISALRLTPDFTTVRLHDFVTGRATVLTRLPGPVGSLALSPDENTVVYAEAPPVGSNIMLLENFR